MRKMLEVLKDYFKEEDGMGTVEVILIIVDNISYTFSNIYLCI